MKRRISSDLSFGSAPLKRRSSSLFSIDTVNESSSRPISELNLASRIVIEKVRSVSYSSPYEQDATETEVSSTEGFYIGEESDDETGNSHQLIHTFHSDTIQTESVIETKVETKAIQQSEDLRTGIVFEAGSKHFDRHNRLHKERPVRVTSIMDALEKSSIQGKYMLLEDNVDDSSSPEKLFLDDDDYLQVHLPGYMKR